MTDGQDGQTTRMAEGRGQDSAFFPSRATRSGLFAEVIAGGRVPWASALTTYAGHWRTMP